MNNTNWKKKQKMSVSAGALVWLRIKHICERWKNTYTQNKNNKLIQEKYPNSEQQPQI